MNLRMGGGLTDKEEADVEVLRGDGAALELERLRDCGQLSWGRVVQGGDYTRKQHAQACYRHSQNRLMPMKPPTRKTRPMRRIGEVSSDQTVRKPTMMA